MKKKPLIEFLLLFFIFCLAFVPRLYKINNPVADWHSWRQADTAAVAKNLFEGEFNLLYPRADNYFPMSEGALPNPERYFLNEFPFYNALVAVCYYFVGVNEAYARLVSIFFSSLTSVFLYLLLKKFLKKTVAFLAAIFFAVLPFNIYYGRVIMPDPTFIFFSVFSLYSVLNWVEKEKFWLAIVSVISLSLAMLIKPYAIFLGLPLSYLVLRKWGLKSLKRWDVYFVFVLSFIPLVFWRYHINQHPEGMFGSGWLINQGNIRFKGAFFRWLIFDRMNRLIFATGGFVLFWLGLISSRNKKEGLFFLSWLTSVALYMIYFARGNVTHDYYQLPLVPVGCVFMAKGVAFLFHLGKSWLSKLINTSLALVFIALMLAFGWYEVRGFFNINHPEIVEAGKAVDELTPRDARVIAPYNRDPAFLYQTNRTGWSDLGPIEEWINEGGATHYVSVNFDETTKKLEENCQIIKKTERYVIIDLQSCVPEMLNSTN